VAGQTNRAVFIFEKHFNEMLVNTKKN